MLVRTRAFRSPRMSVVSGADGIRRQATRRTASDVSGLRGAAVGTAAPAAFTIA